MACARCVRPKQATRIEAGHNLHCLDRSCATCLPVICTCIGFHFFLRSSAPPSFLLSPFKQTTSVTFTPVRRVMVSPGFRTFQLLKCLLARCIFSPPASTTFHRVHSILSFNSTAASFLAGVPGCPSCSSQRVDCTAPAYFQMRKPNTVVVSLCVSPHRTAPTACRTVASALFKVRGT
jgi:hypothetical protein